MGSMRRFAVSAALLAILALIAGRGIDAATLPELFQKVKVRVAGGDFSGGLEALNDLDAEAARPEKEAARAALRPAAAFYRGVCLASLGNPEEARAAFKLYLSANPDKNIDRKAYSRKVVAAFEKARSAAPASGTEELSALAVAYRQTTYARARSDPPGADWAAGPVKFLLTPEEIRAFSRISDDSERAEFVARFWLRSEATPDERRSALRQEFDRRVGFADEHFSEGSIRGSLTDRGMVFLLLGPPTGVLRRPIKAAEDSPAMLNMNSPTNPAPRAPIGLSPTDQPSNWREVWRYGRELLPADVAYHQVDFAFDTRIDYGRNVLQREAAVVRTLEAARLKWRAAGG